jgi:F-type H+-transporting ATPase subunit b
MFQHLILAAEAHAANHPIWPEAKELIWAALAFFIVAGLLWWKALPPAKQAMKDRTERIAKEIDDAAKASADAGARLTDVQTRIANAENERQRILVEARQTAEALKAQIIARAADDAEGIKTRAVGDIESSKQQAIADLQAEVAALALGAAEAVIAKNLDAGTQAGLIDSYIDQVGAQA